MTLVLVVFAPQVSSLMAPEEAFEKNGRFGKIYVSDFLYVDRKKAGYL